MGEDAKVVELNGVGLFLLGSELEGDLEIQDSTSLSMRKLKSGFCKTV